MNVSRQQGLKKCSDAGRRAAFKSVEHDITTTAAESLTVKRTISQLCPHNINGSEQVFLTAFNTAYDKAILEFTELKSNIT